MYYINISIKHMYVKIISIINNVVRFVSGINEPDMCQELPACSRQADTTRN